MTRMCDNNTVENASNSIDAAIKISEEHREEHPGSRYIHRK